MSCDITMHSQVKKDGKWIWHDFEIYDNRNYTLFGILDGTRGNKFHPISHSKRFPEDSEDKIRPWSKSSWDIDDVTESGIWMGYAGCSYLNLTELKTFDWKTHMEEDLFTKEIIPYLEACAETYGGPENVRIVFGYSV